MARIPFNEDAILIERHTLEGRWVRNFETQEWGRTDGIAICE